MTCTLKIATLKEIKQDQTNGKIDRIHGTGRCNNAKIATVPKLIYQFKAIFIKVSAVFLQKLRK